MGKSELGSRAGNSGTRCPGRWGAGGWGLGEVVSIYEENFTAGQDCTVSIPPHASACSSPRVYKGPLHDHYTRIIILWAACVWGCCQGWPKPRLSDDGNTAPRLSWHSVRSHPTSSPVWAPRKKENNQSQALLSTGLWLLTKMEKTQWISMPHKHHWDGQCRCLLDGGSTSEEVELKAEWPSGRWSALTLPLP